MADVSPEFIERYQIELEKNPRSRVFAPLAEAYRRMGLIDEAFRICSRGVQLHPDFASGRVAFAKLLIDRQEWEKALEQLEAAATLSPDNLLAHSLMGDTLLQLRRPKDALKAFKMALYLSPGDERALKAVRKWEFLSADDYDEELFKMRPVFQAEPAPLLEPLPDSRGKKGATSAGPAMPTPQWRARELERAVSLADAFTVRGDLDRATQVLSDALSSLGSAPEIERRLGLLMRRSQSSDAAPTEARVEGDRALGRGQRRVRKLQLLLQRINDRRDDI